MEKLQKKLRAVEEQHAEEVVTTHLDNHEKKGHDHALFFLGGVRATNGIADALSIEVIRALINFQEEKRYESLGYTNFVDFLENSEYAPMSKNQFYDRKALLEKEGDKVFELMNSLSMPVSKRKLLGKGNIQLDGETVIVTGDDGEQTEIEIKDRSRLLETLAALADANAEKTRKIQTQQSKIEKGDTEVLNLQKKLDEAKARPGEAKPLDFLIRVTNSIDAMAEMVKQQTLVEKERDGEFYLNGIYAAFVRLQHAYGRKDLTFGDVPEMENNEFAVVTSSLDDEELAAMME